MKAAPAPPADGHRVPANMSAACRIDDNQATPAIAAKSEAESIDLAQPFSVQSLMLSAIDGTALPFQVTKRTARLRLPCIENSVGLCLRRRI